MFNIVHSALEFKKLSPPQKIALSFLLMIFIGTILLLLPISTKNGEVLHPLDAFFMATSATCVTGLTSVTVAETFSIFGQLVILVLVQIGGLGLMTLMAMLISFTKQKLSMQEKKVMKEMLNKEHMLDMKRYLTDILIYTFCFEGIGAILLSIRFIPIYGLGKGIFHSIFLAVSGFCNAGFDLFGSTSLQAYVHDPLICFTIMGLITLGGLGFAVWFDVRDKIVPFLNRNITFKKFKKSLSLHTKIVLCVSAVLVVLPAIIIMMLEYQNPNTIGNFTFSQKLMTAMFESVSLRTAGFTTIAYSMLTPATNILMMIVMFIGGSPGGTAGGIKTTTMAVLVVYVLHMLKGKEQIIIWKRTLRKEVIIHAMGVFFINFITLLLGMFLLAVVEKHDVTSLCFEVVSALSTVGSTLGVTSELSSIGKVVIILLMYVGRIGIATFIFSLARPRTSSDASNKVSFPNGNIIVG